MSDISVSTTVNPNFSYPAGTILGKMRYTLLSSTGIPLSLQEVAVPVVDPVVFTGEAVGSYTVNIQRLTAAGATIGPIVTVSAVVAPPPPVLGDAPASATVTIV